MISKFRNFDFIVSKYARGLHRYVILWQATAQKYVPVDKGHLKKSGRVIEKGLGHFVITYNTPYAAFQHDENLFHFGNPSKSISQAYSGAKQAKLNLLEHQLVDLQQRKPSKNIRNRYEAKLRQIGRLQKSTSYNYSFGYRVLRGWIPKNPKLAKRAVRKGALVRYRSLWLLRPGVYGYGSELPSFSDFMKKIGDRNG